VEIQVAFFSLQPIFICQLNNVNTEQGVVNPKQSYQMSDEELEEEVFFVII
jgi:hypothetical protein